MGHPHTGRGNGGAGQDDGVEWGVYFFPASYRRLVTVLDDLTAAVSANTAAVAAAVALIPTLTAANDDAGVEAQVADLTASTASLNSAVAAAAPPAPPAA
jgi:hypothetical protein